MESNETQRNDMTSLNSDFETLKIITPQINIPKRCWNPSFDVMDARMQQLLSSRIVRECSSDQEN